MLALILLLVSIALLIRTGLIMTGVWKEPILHTFEKYGDVETVYYPLPSLLLWSGVLIISTTPWMMAPLRSWVPLVVPGIALIYASYHAYIHPEIAKQYPHIFMSYPRWYFELRERTTRYERRRIAYMWLCLPRRMQWAYNGSDPAFNQWADLVIMATMTYEEDPELLRSASSDPY